MKKNVLLFLVLLVPYNALAGNGLVFLSNFINDSSDKCSLSENGAAHKSAPIRLSGQSSKDQKTCDISVAEEDFDALFQFCAVSYSNNSDTQKGSCAFSRYNETNKKKYYHFISNIAPGNTTGQKECHYVCKTI